MTPNRAPSPRAVELVVAYGLAQYAGDHVGKQRAALLEYIADLEARAEAPKGEAVAWEHTLHMDLGQTETRLTDEADDEPFGRWNVDYDPFYRVTKRPLIYGDTAPPSPKAEPNQSALAAIDKLMHAWVMGERWVRLDDVKAALATPKDASTQPVGEVVIDTSLSEAARSALKLLELGSYNMAKEALKIALATQATAIPVVSAVLEPLDFKDSRCSNVRRANGQPYPRTCQICELGPCRRATQATATQATT